MQFGLFALQAGRKAILPAPSPPTCGPPGAFLFLEGSVTLPLWAFSLGCVYLSQCCSVVVETYYAPQGSPIWETLGTDGLEIKTILRKKMGGMGTHANEEL